MKRMGQILLSSLLVFGLMGCTQNNAETTAVTTEATETSSAEAEQAEQNGDTKDTLKFTAGTYEGRAVGRIGEIVVDVVLSEDKIESIAVKEHVESAGISDLPLQRIPEEIVQYQSLNVDSISGATITSYGVVNAVTNALESADADVAALRQVAVNKEAVPIEDMQTQIVVAGGGMAGLMAAVSAAHEGAEVILVEKLPFAGGSLFIAGGGMVTVESEIIGQTEEVDDSLETSYEKSSIN